MPLHNDKYLEGSKINNKQLKQLTERAWSFPFYSGIWLYSLNLLWWCGMNRALSLALSRLYLERFGEMRKSACCNYWNLICSAWLCSKEVYKRHSPPKFHPGTNARGIFKKWLSFWNFENFCERFLQFWNFSGFLNNFNDFFAREICAFS